ncbi:hypothetical protein CCACVL1_06799 [Corchorus capsularis]|uniref:Uncharacterized protein n=1 Tax=Corchorus capsularis TaxID=210143 RepID=A0A1R3JCM5_COCAP|nr:hypothetical protein CCACVL1_06799 [Corchorus capsularis]
MARNWEGYTIAIEFEGLWRLRN